MMSEALEFLKAALPWIAVGLFLAIFYVSREGNAAQTHRSVKQTFSKIAALPGLLFFVMAAWEYADHNANNALTWLIVGAATAAINFSNKKRLDD